MIAFFGPILLFEVVLVLLDMRFCDFLYADNLVGNKVCKEVLQMTLIPLDRLTGAFFPTQVGYMTDVNYFSSLATIIIPVLGFPSTSLRGGGG